MKRDFRFATVLTVSLAALAFPASAFAQVAPDPEDPVLLTPFVVTSASQRGYLATETVSATRIKTDLKDVGASIDVLTETFLDDIGATDMWDGMKYVANVEVFTGRGDDDAGNNSQWFSAPYISRGLRTDSVRLDFFPTAWVPIDRYNTENLTFLRGPNAILFGIGNPAGIIGASTKRALLGKDLYSFGYITDDNETQRFELDISKVLLENQLAVRIAAVSSDKHSFRKPSLVEREAIYATVSYKPFSRTTITVNVEDGVYNRLHEQTNITTDAYTPWVLAGRPTVNWKTGKGQNAPGKGNFSTAVGSGFSTQGTGKKLIYVEGSNTIMDWSRMAGSAQITDLSVPSADRGALGSIAFNEQTNLLTDPVTGETWRVDLAAQAFGDLRRNDTDYDNKSVFLTQNLLADPNLGNLDVELAWNEFSTAYVFDNFGTATRIEVDPNELLPDGSPNPNVGRPYIETSNHEMNREKHVIESKRATVSYTVDLEDRKIFRNIGLGKYNVLGLYENIRDDSWHIFSRFVDTHNLKDPVTGANIHDPRLRNGNNALFRRYYLKPGDSYYHLNGPRVFNLNGKYIQESSGVVTRTLDDQIQIQEVPAYNDPRRAYNDTESFVWAVQGFWWQAKEGYYRLKGMYGTREDTQRKADMAGSWGLTKDPVTERNAIDVHDFSSVERAGRWNAEAKLRASTKTYNVMVQPHRVMSVYYNYSDVFNAVPSSFVDINKNPLRAAYGDTNDYGVKLDLFGERAFITATYYETAIFDRNIDQFGDGTITTRLNQIWDAIAEAARAGSDSANEAKARANRFDLRPFGYRDDTTKGLEFSLVANLTRNWRARLTAGSQKTTIDRLYDEVSPYLDEHRAFWHGYDSTPLLGSSNPAAMDTVAEAIADLEQRFTDRRAFLGQRPSDQRQYNASLSTNYDFSSGRLTGFRVGGGFRWSSENILGYARDANGRNLDPSKPFKGDPLFDTDLTIGYSRRFSDRNILWDIQLNVYNVFDDTGIEAKQAVDNGAGSPVVVRSFLKAPRTFQLSTSLRF